VVAFTVDDGTAVRLGERFAVTFQRTLRVPDDGRVYDLPPGIGPFPVVRVEDHADRVPDMWREHGGVFIPVHQREALWLGFRAAGWKPSAVKVGVGGINAVTGDSWDLRLHAGAQDYLVCPPQLWLDGVKTGPGRIRQFVASPLGEGFTIEAQLTGADALAGIQIAVFDPRPGRFPDEPPFDPMGHGPMAGGPLGALAMPHELGIAAGGTIQQSLYPDPYGVETWEETPRVTVWVHLVNSAQFLRTHALSTGKLGATGFCWGGGMTNNLAVALGADQVPQPGLDSPVAARWCKTFDQLCESPGFRHH